MLSARRVRPSTSTYPPRAAGRDGVGAGVIVTGGATGAATGAGADCCTTGSDLGVTGFVAVLVRAAGFVSTTVPSLVVTASRLRSVLAKLTPAPPTIAATDANPRN